MNRQPSIDSDDLSRALGAATDEQLLSALHWRLPLQTRRLRSGSLKVTFTLEPAAAPTRSAPARPGKGSNRAATSDPHGLLGTSRGRGR